METEHSSEQKRISLTLMGSFRVRVDGRDSPKLPRKAQALIAVLALRSGGKMAREEAVELLWSGEAGEDRCATLRQTLGSIRDHTGIGLVRLSGGMLSLPQTGICVDALQFEALAGSSSGHELARCAALYRGELLADVAMVTPRFDEWLAVERIRLAALAAEIMRIVILCLVDLEEHDAAVTVAYRLVALDELREDSHHLLISVLGRCGRPVEALRHYGVCEQLLTPLPAKPEPVLAGSADPPVSFSGGGKWWLRGALAGACLFIAMVGGVALEPGRKHVSDLPQSLIVAVADTIGLARISAPRRSPSGTELSGW